ncbi:histidinolphosphatase-like protein [Ophiostoma piceae UAMH 11346]|uniref:Histidinolphosphatase-like protein n=1 Tax=Ophiostoma piceae (strain UAMH 11346) TaxID=1262450 RepID=S3C203_OPHP1|nr:histidinolphosphatase-like protein [Ophiostoma piceae UAMH 11346]
MSSGEAPTASAIVDAATPAPVVPSAPSGITLRSPSKYLDASSRSSSSSAADTPPGDWLARSWSVTHSTLSMWRSAQNVRISYGVLPDDDKGRARNEDHVEYESNKKEAEGTKKKVKSVQGTNTASAPGVGFDWRGKGWLFFVTSHWEILGWGERPLADGQVERWAVTWFAPTLFTKEGLDYYSDRREGLSSETTAALKAAADAAWPAPLLELAKDLEPIDIKLPWSE